MQQIKDMEFSGERPLFASHDLQLDNVVIHAGESALKECSNIIAIGCRFEGKYPFWHVDGFTIKNSLFTEGGRAALWYSQNLVMTDTRLIIYLCTARTLKSGTTLKMETTRSSIVRTWKSVMRSSTRKTLSGIRRMLPYTIPRLTASTWDGTRRTCVW